MEHQFHCLCCLSLLTGGYTAILKAVLYGHLAVLQTLAEQYGREPAAKKEGKCEVLFEE